MFTRISVFLYESQPHLRDREETKYTFREYRYISGAVFGCLRNYLEVQEIITALKTRIIINISCDTANTITYMEEVIFKSSLLCKSYQNSTIYLTQFYLIPEVKQTPKMLVSFILNVSLFYVYDRTKGVWIGLWA